MKITRLESCDKTDVVMDGAAGDFILVKPNELHQYRNTGEEPLVFMCMVPSQYE